MNHTTLLGFDNNYFIFILGQGAITLGRSLPPQLLQSSIDEQLLGKSSHCLHRAICPLSICTITGRWLLLHPSGQIVGIPIATRCSIELRQAEQWTRALQATLILCSSGVSAIVLSQSDSCFARKINCAIYHYHSFQISAYAN